VLEISHAASFALLNAGVCELIEQNIVTIGQVLGLTEAASHSLQNDDIQQKLINNQLSITEVLSEGNPPPINQHQSTSQVNTQILRHPGSLFGIKSGEHCAEQQDNHLPTSSSSL
tara:strand:+ start:28 stop:372 length:345 start_codon:yes stop_codon:yes gene_type:complete